MPLDCAARQRGRDVYSHFRHAGNDHHVDLAPAQFLDRRTEKVLKHRIIFLGVSVCGEQSGYAVLLFIAAAFAIERPPSVKEYSANLVRINKGQDRLVKCDALPDTVPVIAHKPQKRSASVLVSDKPGYVVCGCNLFEHRRDCTSVGVAPQKETWVYAAFTDKANPVRAVIAPLPGVIFT